MNSMPVAVKIAVYTGFVAGAVFIISAVASSAYLTAAIVAPFWLGTAALTSSGFSPTLWQRIWDNEQQAPKS